MTARDCIDHGYAGNGQGYASVRRNGKRVLLHRWLFGQNNGYLPEAVMHACDNTRCINLDHLRPGTRAMNNADRAAKGRSTKALYAKRKLATAEAEEIRRRFALRKPPPQRDRRNGPVALAREFGVDPNVIYQIASGRTYFA